jgi:hypothetical protein
VLGGCRAAGLIKTSSDTTISRTVKGIQRVRRAFSQQQPQRKNLRLDSNLTMNLNKKRTVIFARIENLFF